MRRFKKEPKRELVEFVSSQDMKFLASAVIFFDSPSFSDMANALLFPGIPYKRLYVGDRVSSENSKEAFSTPSVDTAYSLSSL